MTAVGADVTVRLFAAARAAAGHAEVQVPAGSLAEVLTALEAAVAPAPQLPGVVARCSFLLDGTVVRGPRDAVAVAPGSVVDVLPPFAGG